MGIIPRARLTGKSCLFLQYDFQEASHGLWGLFAFVINKYEQGNGNISRKYYLCTRKMLAYK